jgi:hypothetical protein
MSEIVETETTLAGYQIEQEDLIVVDGDFIEVFRVEDTDDEDEIKVTGFSHSTGDTVEYSLMYDDEYAVWMVD